MTVLAARPAAEVPHRDEPRCVPGAVYDVHLWAVRLEASHAVMKECLAVMAPDETLRFAALPEEPAGREFAVSRGVLRMLLAHYDGRSPDELRFAHSPAGKPALSASRHGVRFSTARSHGIAVYAITLCADVGVDVERVRPRDDLMPFARRAFTAEELSALDAATAAERPRAFFRLWTRREARAKADAPGDPHALHDLAPAEGYVGALAYHGERRRLVTHALAEARHVLHRFPP